MNHQKFTFQPGMYMKTKLESKVPGVRCEVSGDQAQYDWGNSGARLRFLTFQPGMCMKTNDAVRNSRPNWAWFSRATVTPRFWLLRCKYAGATGDVDENKGPAKSTRWTQVRNRRSRAPRRRMGEASSQHEMSTFQAGMCMKRNSPGSGVRSLEPRKHRARASSGWQVAPESNHQSQIANRQCPAPDS